MFRFRYAIAATLTTAFAAWMGFRPSGDFAAKVVSDFGLLAAALVAGIACLRRGSPGGVAGRRGWLLTALSCVLWAVGQAIWTVSQLVFDRPLPFPSPADVAFLAAIGVGVGALFAFLSTPPALANRFRTLVDGLIVALALLFIAWVTFLGNLVDAGPSVAGWERILTLAYPLADVARLAIALIVVAGAGRGRKSLTLLAAGFGVMAVTDCIYSYLLSQDAYRTGDILDAGWMLAFVLLALAAGCADTPGEDAAPLVPVRIVGPYLPVLAGAAVLGTGWLLRPELSGLEVWTAGAVLTLVGVRQLVTHFENLSLTRRLETGMAEIRFQARLLDAVGQAVVAKNAEGFIVYWNRAAERLLGWTEHEVLGKVASDFMVSDLSQETAGEIRRLLLAGKSWSGELIMRRRDGTDLPGFITDAPVIDDSGRRVGMIAVVSDITELKRAQTHQRRLEDDLRQAQKMELIGRLAGGISHDFNNALTVVMGQGEMLLAALDPNGESASRVRAIHHAAGRAVELTDQLLTFSRRHVTTGDPADLNAVVAGISPVLERLIGSHIDLEVRLCDRPLTVSIDAPQLQQLVLSLAVNAGEAMPQGGRLTITTAPAVALSGPITAVLRVADTGVGMEESARAQVFEPFFTTKAAGDGAGLGLSAVYGLVRQHGGEVDATSSPGVGSVFTVSLPLIDAGGSRLDGPPVPDPVVRVTGTVLLVEDEAAVRELAREVLELQGHLVLEAADGAEALAVAEAHDWLIDVLLTDVVLPQIPGTEVADRLLAARPGLRVIFMSGYAERHLDRVEGRQAMFLAKPFRPADLASAVAEGITSPARLATASRPSSPRRSTTRSAAPAESTTSGTPPTPTEHPATPTASCGF